MVYLNADAGVIFRFNGTCDSYQLNPGQLTKLGAISNVTVGLTKAAIFVTNCTDGDQIGAYLETIESYYKSHLDEVNSDVISQLVDPFSKSVLMANFATCAVAVSGWMLFLVQMLSITYKPLILRAATILLASTHTYFLSRFNNLMKMQFEQCYQDNYEMIRLVSDSMLMSSVFYLVQIFVWATCIYSVHSVVRRLRQSKPGGSYKQRLDWLLVSAIVYDVAVLLTMVFAGLMHFYAVPFENYSVTYWLNVMEMCLTCFAYLYMFCILSLFIMTRVSFSFRFQSLVLIMLIIGFLILATALNMIWLIDAHENMKWLIGVYSLMQVIYVNLVYELLANWKMYDRNAETRGIVGREIPGGVAGSTPSKETTYVAQ